MVRAFVSHELSNIEAHEEGLRALSLDPGRGIEPRFLRSERSVLPLDEPGVGMSSVTGAAFVRSPNATKPPSFR